MKKLKVLLVAMLIIPCAALLVACSGGDDDGTRTTTTTLTLADPTNVKLESGILKWDAVTNCIVYRIKVSDFDYYYDTNLLEFDVQEQFNPQGQHVVAVKALTGYKEPIWEGVSETKYEFNSSGYTAAAEKLNVIVANGYYSPKQITYEGTQYDVPAETDKQALADAFANKYEAEYGVAYCLQLADSAFRRTLIIEQGSTAYFRTESGWGGAVTDSRDFTYSSGIFTFAAEPQVQGTITIEDGVMSYSPTEGIITGSYSFKVNPVLESTRITLTVVFEYTRTSPF